MSSKVSANANRLITDFITGIIWPVKCRLTVRTVLRVGIDILNKSKKYHYMKL